MTYKIWYKEHKMFDIDIYIACTEKDENGERKYYGRPTMGGFFHGWTIGILCPG